MIAVIGSCFSSGRDGAGRVVSDWESGVIVARGEDEGDELQQLDSDCSAPW